jgi:hypothetical protein
MWLESTQRKGIFMRKLGIVFMMAGALSPVFARADARTGWLAMRCLEESTGHVLNVVLEDHGPRRSHDFFQGQARISPPSSRVAYIGTFTQTLIQDRTRLDGYYDVAIRAVGPGGVHAQASLIRRPALVTGEPGDSAFGHIELFVPGTRQFQQYLVSCAPVR